MKRWMSLLIGLLYLANQVVLGSLAESQAFVSSHARLQDAYGLTLSKTAPLILIQDVHMNAEVQANIAETLQTLIDQGRVDRVGVEGAFDPLNFEPFRAFQDQTVVRRVAQTYLEKAWLAAPSYVGLTSRSPLPDFVGVDDRAAYRANVQAYREGRRVQDQVKHALKKEHQTLTQQKEQILSPRLKEWDAFQTAYGDGHVGLGPYVRWLSQQQGDSFWNPVLDSFRTAYEIEMSLDFEQVNRERRKVLDALIQKLSAAEKSAWTTTTLAFKWGRMGLGAYYQTLQDACEKKGIGLRETPAFHSYVQYVLLSESLNPAHLFAEVKKLEKDVLASLIETPQQKELMAASRRLTLKQKLIEFRLTPVEWDDYKAGPRAPVLAPFESFYHHAEARSQKIIQNLLSVPARSALVIGGFHTPHITHRLRSQEIPYVVLSPKLTHINKEETTTYLSLFEKNKTPLQELLEGEKLFINPETFNISAPEFNIPLRLEMARHMAGAFPEKTHIKRTYPSGPEVGYPRTNPRLFAGSPRGREVVGQSPNGVKVYREKPDNGQPFSSLWYGAAFLLVGGGAVAGDLGSWTELLVLSAWAVPFGVMFGLGFFGWVATGFSAVRKAKSRDTRRVVRDIFRRYYTEDEIRLDQPTQKKGWFVETQVDPTTGRLTVHPAAWLLVDYRWAFLNRYLTQFLLPLVLTTHEIWRKKKLPTLLIFVLFPVLFVIGLIRLVRPPIKPYAHELIQVLEQRRQNLVDGVFLAEHVYSKNLSEKVYDVAGDENTSHYKITVGLSDHFDWLGPFPSSVPEDDKRKIKVDFPMDLPQTLELKEYAASREMAETGPQLREEQDVQAEIAEEIRNNLVKYIPLIEMHDSINRLIRTLNPRYKIQYADAEKEWIAKRLHDEVDAKLEKDRIDLLNPRNWQYLSSGLGSELSEVFQVLVERCGLHKGSRVIDLGSGINTWLIQGALTTDAHFTGVEIENDVFGRGEALMAQLAQRQIVNPRQIKLLNGNYKDKRLVSLADYDVVILFPPDGEDVEIDVDEIFDQMKEDSYLVIRGGKEPEESIRQMKAHLVEEWRMMKIFEKQTPISMEQFYHRFWHNFDPRLIPMAYYLLVTAFVLFGGMFVLSLALWESGFGSAAVWVFWAPFLVGSALIFYSVYPKDLKEDNELFEVIVDDSESVTAPQKISRLISEPRAYRRALNKLTLDTQKIEVSDDPLSHQQEQQALLLMGTHGWEIVKGELTQYVRQASWSHSEEFEMAGKYAIWIFLLAAVELEWPKDSVQETLNELVDTRVYEQAVHELDPVDVFGFGRFEAAHFFEAQGLTTTLDSDRQVQEQWKPRKNSALWALRLFLWVLVFPALETGIFQVGLLHLVPEGLMSIGIPSGLAFSVGGLGSMAGFVWAHSVVFRLVMGRTYPAPSLISLFIFSFVYMIPFLPYINGAQPYSSDIPQIAFALHVGLNSLRLMVELVIRLAGRQPSEFRQQLKWWPLSSLIPLEETVIPGDQTALLDNPAVPLFREHKRAASSPRSFLEDLVVVIEGSLTAPGPVRLTPSPSRAPLISA